MRVFRNFLVAWGASCGASAVVRLVYWWLVYPVFVAGSESHSVESAVALAVVAGALAAILAGIVASLAIETGSPTRWALLLALLVSLDSPGIRPGTFESALAQAKSQFGVSLVGGAIAFGTFYLAHGFLLRRSTLASAR